MSYIQWNGIKSSGNNGIKACWRDTSVVQSFRATEQN